MNASLIEAAKLAQGRAYAPYSGYFVGAAVLDETGAIWSGCNVENVSYGLSVCAERVAVSKMVSEGRRQVRAVAVVTKDGGTPCGMCLQTLLEFSPDPTQTTIVLVSQTGTVREFVLSEMIPFGFSTQELNRT